MLIGIQGYCSSTYMIKWKVQRGHLNSTPILFSANIALTALCKSQTNNIFHHLSGSKFKYNWLLSLFNVKNTKMNMHCLCLVSCVCKCLGIVFVLCLVSADVSGLSLSCVLCLLVSRDCLCPVSCVCRCLGIILSCVLCLLLSRDYFVMCLVSAGVSGLSLSCVVCLPVSRDCLCPVSCVCRCLGIVFVLCLVSAGVAG
jgi:hypothetical protein